MHVPSENPEVSSANPGCGRGLPFNDEEFVKDLSLLLVLAGVGTLNQSSSSKEWMQVGGRFHRIVNYTELHSNSATSTTAYNCVEFPNASRIP